MDNSKKPKNETAQLRLLLPQKWISELDHLAASRCLTRLGLIRFYIQLGMKEDCSQMAEYLQQERTRKNILASISKGSATDDDCF
jgi:hypothetical protein